MAAREKLYDNPRSPKRGQQEAKKGDVRKMDKEIQDGPDKIEFKGDYESIGSEPQPTSEHQRPAGDPEKIDKKDWDETNEEAERWRKAGKKGPVPAFKDVPKEDNSFPDKEGGKPRQQYEHWRLRKKEDVPTS